MPEYLTPAEFPSIRAAIDVSLDASNLPDDVIGLPMYRQDAERWVVAMNPLAAAYELGSEPYLKTQVAAIYACAALVLPSVPQLTGESYGTAFRYTRKEVDPAALQQSLWDRARGAIRAALGEEALEVRAPARFIFTRAKGRRGA